MWKPAWNAVTAMIVGTNNRPVMQYLLVAMAKVDQDETLTSCRLQA